MALCQFPNINTCNKEGAGGSGVRSTLASATAYAGQVSFAAAGHPSRTADPRTVTLTLTLAVALT